LPALGIIVEGMQYGQSIPLLGDWLKITYIENPHMAFGLDITGKLFLVFFSFAATIGMVLFLYKHRSGPMLLRLSLALIIAGALGNLIDRAFYGVLYGQAPLFYGNVVDFMDLDLFTITFSGSSFKFWPIFNVADAAVSVGVVMLLITGIPHSEKKVASEKDGNKDGNMDTATSEADKSPSGSPGDGHA
jgi:signal peptidase II